METPLFERGEIVSGVYEIRSLLGGGGMSQVYEAHDHALNRRVALKAARSGLDPSLLRREGQGLAAVRHPGVVGVYALGEHRGIHYLVMERLQGITLESHLEARHAEGELLSVAEALTIATPLADVLAAVHAAGIAHRDVKPSNVVLAMGERVVLTDFGIIVPERTVRPNAPLVGTVEYMAPETISATTSPGNAFLVDLYAFGVLLFELIAGHRPFDGGSPRETLARHMRDPVPSLAGVRDDVPPLLDGLVRELLAKDPYDRPQSMESVVARMRLPSMRSMTATRSAPPGSTYITLPPQAPRRR